MLRYVCIYFSHWPTHVYIGGWTWSCLTIELRIHMYSQSHFYFYFVAWYFLLFKKAVLGHLYSILFGIALIQLFFQPNCMVLRFVNITQTFNFLSIIEFGGWGLLVCYWLPWTFHSKRKQKSCSIFKSNWFSFSIRFIVSNHTSSDEWSGFLWEEFKTVDGEGVSGEDNNRVSLQ